MGMIFPVLTSLTTLSLFVEALSFSVISLFRIVVMSMFGFQGSAVY